MLIPARVREKLCVDTDPNSGRNMYIGPEFGQIITISVKLCFHVFCATTTHMVVVLYAHVATIALVWWFVAYHEPHIPRIYLANAVRGYFNSNLKQQQSACTHLTSWLFSLFAAVRQHQTFRPNVQYLCVLQPTGRKHQSGQATPFHLMLHHLHKTFASLSPSSSCS